MTARDITPSEEEPQKVGRKQAESAATALLRLAGEYEFVRHTTGVLYALNGSDDPIGLDALIGRLARRYAKSGKVASAEARTSVRELLDDPDAPERDLTEELEGVNARLEEKRASQEAARRAELEAAREAELAEARAEAAQLLREPNLIERFGKEIGSRRWRGRRSCREALASRLRRRANSTRSASGSELMKGQSAVGKTFLAEVILEFFPPASILKANSMSPKALFYRALSQGDSGDLGEFVVDLSHTIMYLGEAATSAEVEFTVGDHPPASLGRRGRPRHRDRR